jgi:hypothetical protein
MLTADLSDFFVDTLVKNTGFWLMITASDAPIGSSIFSLSLLLWFGLFKLFFSLTFIINFLDGFFSSFKDEALLPLAKI